MGRIKALRRAKDPRKQDFSPTRLDCGDVVFYLARHFGFCYGVENAIDISYKALRENPGKKIYLVSQMIHNQHVTGDLQRKGLQFILGNDGKQLITWDSITGEDIVITPAFGVTLEVEQILSAKGAEVKRYDTTCPFVRKVWDRAAKLGEKNFTVVIHGKRYHEETRATFSRSTTKSHAVVIRNLEEAKLLSEFIIEERPAASFYEYFSGKYSSGFDPARHLQRIGVVNQTTMIADETHAIIGYLRSIMQEKHGKQFKEYFAETRDTLCYATNENQRATQKLLATDAHLALIVGSYNSSNTSHIAKLCEQKYPTYFIHSKDEIQSRYEICHFTTYGKRIATANFVPEKKPLKVLLTSGASCPDNLLDDVILKILQVMGQPLTIDQVLSRLD